MNEGHLQFCTSDDWRAVLEEQILPRALGRVDLGPQVVEVGPGPGFTTEFLLRSSARVAALELDPALAARLAGRIGGRAAVLVGDGRAAGLAGGSFTGAASFHVLHHVATDDDQNRVFAELARLLRPSGALLLADGFDSEGVRLFHEGDDYNPIDPGSLPSRLRAAGFTGIEVETYDLGWICTAALAASGPSRVTAEGRGEPGPAPAGRAAMAGSRQGGAAAPPLRHRCATAQLVLALRSARAVALEPASDHPGEDGRPRPVDVLGRGEQNDLAGAPSTSHEVLDGLPSRRPAQLGPVAAGELLESVRVVPVPLAQLGARRRLLAPLVDADTAAGQAPRPEPVDEHALLGTGSLRVLVDPADLDLWPGCGCRHGGLPVRRRG